MGDVLHLMPALSDLMAAQSNVVVDWMVEDSFAEIPTWHPSVDRVIKVSTRRWRSLRWQNLKEFFAFVKELRGQPYDLVIDAQGLMKSAAIARFAKLEKGGVRAGFSGRSIKESLSSETLNYSLKLPKSLKSLKSKQAQNTIMLFHGTTWATKHLPNQLWRDIADLACDDGYKVLLAWGNEAERKRANWVAELRSEITVLDRSTLTDLAHTIASIDGAIAVDTGLGHMAAALGVPCVSVYGSTNSARLLKSCPKLVSSDDVDAKAAENASVPPCYIASALNPELSAAAIWKRLTKQIRQ